MSFEKTPLRAVTAQYGARKVERQAGNIKTEGGKKQLSVDLDANNVVDGVMVADVYIPAGSLVTAAYVEVNEAFVLGGTTPALHVGTEGSEATNGVAIAEAEAEALGTVDITASAAGTFAASLAADTKIGVASSGAGFTVGTAGKAKVVIEYVQV